MIARDKTTAIVVHASATPADMNIGAEEIRQWHVKERGWSDIGYHFVLRRNGKVESGRDEWRQGAHAAGHNDYTLAICMVGGSDADDITKAENNFTAAQFQTLPNLLRTLLEEYPQVDTILGHRDLPGVKKACPCFNVADHLGQPFEHLTVAT
ncbi:N-acetylmuramoyl-L-alanine amidase [Marivibrio halodurans]|uniref:N-acetylmuramoyl-L-alanine amidase n=1 Tax=Marivibrio halodurans TaxID=2039722 RepID=A0A8J7RZ15_9PROT|nr:N-acetylmuramoyl-L-alanine amidase [Marivibrio halodurans]MBP5855674.1 N-acetylmuramoyl-L-alanine amidase [Marivibrio halodurans]